MGEMARVGRWRHHVWLLWLLLLLLILLQLLLQFLFRQM